MKTAWLLLLLLGVGALGGCAVNPATGKSDFVMMSEQQELGMALATTRKSSSSSPATTMKSSRPTCNG